MGSSISTPSAAGSTDLREYFRPVVTRKWLILAIVAVVTAGTYLYYDNEPSKYRTATRVFIKNTQTDPSLAGILAIRDNQRNVVNQATLLTTPAVAEEVAKRIGWKGAPGDLLGAVTAVPAEDSDFVTITAVAGSGRLAAQIANGFAESFVEIRGFQFRDETARSLALARRELQSLPKTVATQEQRANLAQNIRRLEIVRSLPQGTAEQIDSASSAVAPFEPNPGKAATFAFALALLFAVGFAYALERIDRRINGVDEVEEIFGAPVLTALPHATRTALNLPEFREPVRSLRVNIELASIDQPARTLLVTSARPGEGKSTVVRELARAYAEAGRSVAILEADLRRPTMAKVFGAEPHPGLSDVLAAQGDLESALQVIDIGSSETVDLGLGAAETASVTTIALLPSGTEPPNPPAFLASDQVAAAIDRLTELYDMVIIDTPPVLAVSDALPLMARVDATLIVCRVGKTTREAARRVLDVIARVPSTQVLGIVANDISNREMTEGGYFPYYGQASRLRSKA